MAKTKGCCSCKQTVPISEFSKCRSTKDGLFFQCKLCKAITQKKYRQTKKGRNNHNINSKKYESKENGKIIRRRIIKQYRLRNPEKIKAQNAVNHAITAGKIRPANQYYCLYCPNKAEQFHHPNYVEKNWLDVEPICRRCHKIIHNC